MLDGFILDKHNFYDFLFLLSFAENKIMRKENKLSNMSLELSRLVIHYLSEDQKKCDSDIKKQFRRSITSIGANIHEAAYAESKKDFIHKFKIALKETTESQYWLKVIIHDPPTPQEIKINQLINSIHFMLVKSVKTILTKTESNERVN